MHFWGNSSTGLKQKELTNVQIQEQTSSFEIVIFGVGNPHEKEHWRSKMPYIFIQIFI